MSSSHESKAIKGGLATLGLVATSELTGTLAAEDIARATNEVANQSQSASITIDNGTVTVTGPGDGTIHSQDILHHLAPSTIPEAILSGILGLAATGGFFYTVYHGLKAVFGGDKEHKADKAASHHEKHAATSQADAQKHAEAAMSGIGDMMSGASIAASTSHVNAAAVQQQPQREMAAVGAGRSGNNLIQ